MTRRTTPALVTLTACLLAACGGGSPLDTSDTIANPASTGGRNLSFIYFQKCVQPVLVELITSRIGTNRCADAGCHAPGSAGGAFRVEGDAIEQDPTLPADTLRGTAMFRNFFSARGVVVVGQPSQSRLINKPRGLLQHAGATVLEDPQDRRVKQMEYWITHPMPQDQDEFSSAGNALLDAQTGACNL